MRALRIEIFSALAELLGYPSEEYHRHLKSTAALLRTTQPEAAALLDEYARQIDGQSAQELEEVYTRTFDINPVCCLEAGWHIHGDNYDRGDFLVRMRGHLRDLGVEEGEELPDHLTHVLPVIGRLDEEAAADLAAGTVAPALDKMIAGLSGKQSPYEQLLMAVRQVLLTMIPVSTRSAT